MNVPFFTLHLSSNQSHFISGLSWTVELNIAKVPERDEKEEREETETVFLPLAEKRIIVPTVKEAKCPSPQKEKEIVLRPRRKEESYFKIYKNPESMIPPIIPLAMLTMQNGHKCYRCGKKYSTKGTLNRHLRFECGQKPKFSCPLCNRPFTRNDTLMQHLKVMHPRSNVGVQ